MSEQRIKSSDITDNQFKRLTAAYFDAIRAAELNSSEANARAVMAAIISEAIECGVVSPAVYEVRDKFSDKYVRLCRSVSDAKSNSLSTDSVTHWKGQEK